MTKIFNQSYWECNGKKFKNKLLALEQSNHSLDSIKFYYANSAFAEVNWKTEPTESWYNLMVLRAHQLRDQYDYIRFWYSGGVDSQTILEVFLEQKIFIDEICVNLVSPVDQFIGAANIEQNLVAIPFLKSIEGQLKNTKITINKLGSTHFSKLINDDWITSQMDMSMIQDQPMALYQTGILKEKNNYCDLQGGDKPTLQKEGDQFYAVFVDETFALRITSINLEDFYITPDFPQLHIKQCHMVANHIRNFYPDIGNGFVFSGNFKKKVEIASGIRRPLYAPIDAGKGTNVVGAKSNFLFNQAKNANLTIANKYTDYLNFYQQTIPHLFNQGSIKDGFVGIISQRYKLS